MTDDVAFRVRPRITNAQHHELRSSGFANDDAGWDWESHLERYSLSWIGAYDGEELVGFVNLAWDGGCHATLLDTAVKPSHRHRGIGTRLIEHAVAEARRHPDVEWVHVDATQDLMDRFYVPAGFVPTAAGLVDVRDQAGE